LNYPGDQRVDANDGVYTSQEKGIKVRPVGSWLTGGGVWPPCTAESKSVTTNNAGSEGVVGDLVGYTWKRNNRVAKKESGAQTQKDSDGDYPQQNIILAL
jgi:hypothetical protein